MQSVNFEEANNTIGSSVEGVGGIPIFLSTEGKATACFELTEDEANAVYATGKIFLRFNMNTCMGFPAITKSCLKEKLILKRHVREAAEAEARRPEANEDDI